MAIFGKNGKILAIGPDRPDTRSAPPPHLGGRGALRVCRWLCLPALAEQDLVHARLDGCVVRAEAALALRAVAVLAADDRAGEGVDVDGGLGRRLRGDAEQLVNARLDGCVVRAERLLARIAVAELSRDHSAREAVDGAGGRAGGRARGGRGRGAAAAHLVVPVLGALDVGVLLRAVDLAGAGGRREVPVREHVHAPLGSSQAVGLAQGRHEVGAVVEACLGDGPVRAVRVLDVDGLAVRVPVAEGPGGIAVPHELADAAAVLDAVVRGGLSALPHAEELLDGEVARLVVDADELHLAAASAGAEVLAEDEVDVGLAFLPVPH